MGNWVLYAATVLIWGTSWLGIKFQLGLVAPEVSVAYRFAIAAVLMLAMCLATGRSLRFSRRTHIFLALQGVPMFSINYMIFYVASAYLTSGLVAVTFSTIVAMNIVLGALFLGLPIRPRAVLGAALGMLGLGLVFWHDLAGFESSIANLTGLALALLATSFASLGNIAAVRNHQAGVPVLQGTAIGMAYGAVFTLLTCLARGLPFAFDPSPLYVGALVYLAVFATVVAFLCYLTLLGRIGPDRGAYASVLLPVVALALSTVFEGYAWTWTAIAGVALVIAGNVIMLARFARAQSVSVRS